MGANTTLVYLRSERDERLRLVRNALRIGAMTGLLRLGSVVRVWCSELGEPKPTSGEE